MMSALERPHYKRVRTLLSLLFFFAALPSPEVDNNQKRQRRIFRSQILRHMALSAKEGSDLKLLQSQAARAKALSETKNSEGKERNAMKSLLQGTREVIR